MMITPFSFLSIENILSPDSHFTHLNENIVLVAIILQFNALCCGFPSYLLFDNKIIFHLSSAYDEHKRTSEELHTLKIDVQPLELVLSIAKQRSRVIY